MFRIKICGVRSSDDVQAVLDAGADAVGFNFVSGSRRAIDPDVAERLAHQAQSMQRLALCVGSPSPTVQAGLESGLFTHIQFHGDEPDDVLQRVAGRRVVRAVRLRAAEQLAEQLQNIRDWLERQGRQGWLPAAVLLDAYDAQVLGGTGRQLDWARLALDRPHGSLAGVPVILAGGLTPENVATAVRTVRPAGVDVASGVESAPGQKDPVRIRDFVDAARAAFDEVV